MFVEDIVWADNNTEQKAKEKCSGDAVCLFDAASTNDVSVGVNSQQVNVKLVEENKKMGKTLLHLNVTEKYLRHYWLKSQITVTDVCVSKV